MNASLIRKAAALPPRQLHLIGAGLLLVVAAALWFYALRAPLTALRAVRAEQAQLELAGTDPRPFAAQLAALAHDIELLAKRLGGAPAGGTTQLQVRLIGELGALAQAQGVALHGIVPAPDEMVRAFALFEQPPIVDQRLNAALRAERLARHRRHVDHLGAVLVLEQRVAFELAFQQFAVRQLVHVAH